MYFFQFLGELEDLSLNQRKILDDVPQKDNVRQTIPNFNCVWSSEDPPAVMGTVGILTLMADKHLYSWQSSSQPAHTDITFSYQHGPKTMMCLIYDYSHKHMMWEGVHVGKVNSTEILKQLCCSKPRDRNMTGNSRFICVAWIWIWIISAIWWNIECFTIKTEPPGTKTPTTCRRDFMRHPPLVTDIMFIQVTSVSSVKFH